MRIVLALFFILNSGPSVVAFHDGDHGEWATDYIFGINKKGEFNLRTDTRFGNIVLKKGKYTVTHQTEGGRHLFALAEINKKKSPSQLATFALESRFIPGSESAKNSRIMVHMQADHNYEVLRIEIAGEQGDHFFSKPNAANAVAVKR